MRKVRSDPTTSGEIRAASATLTSKGQLTLPASIRRALALKAGDRLRFEAAAGEKLIVTPLRRGDPLALSGILESAARRVGDVDLAEMRRRAWSRRGRALRRRG
ncbi:MAG TPA: AbrB/MazE/SpoVT family DNA-binding domain-containing protein [Candidatus Limnocylindria bacterium]|nr:AbrB/MazE/SpoVT family DNA-binding domain-containing protein [Candidatus Limnocylindria bacterium]